MGPIFPGVKVKDRYLVQSELGRGGFGVVYLAHDLHLHAKPVVIKVLLKDKATDDWSQKKFAEEVEALARIDHPGVVGIIDVGVSPDGSPFVVLQFVNGVTLRSLLRDKPPSMRDGANVILQIAQALTAAHTCGVWHRDLKPENIMIQDRGKDGSLVKIIDFGIATVKHTSPAVETGRISTDETRIAGSIPYMAPEQLMGKPGASSDIYSLAVIACEMLTGRLPFKADSAVELFFLQQKGLDFRLDQVRPELPPKAHEIVRRALSFEAKDRPDRASDFGDELAAILNSQLNPPPRAASTIHVEMPIVFDPWTPCAPSVFVGRTALLQRILWALDEGRSVSIVGDWRIGKSSVLDMCLRRMAKSGRATRFLSGERKEGISPAEFVQAATGQSSGPDADTAADALSTWAKQNSKPGLLPVLLVDEFDSMLRRFDSRFFERLRGMLDYIALVVSSRRELDHVYKDLGTTSPFHNRLELHWIGLLEPLAAEELLRRGVPVLPAESQNLIREWAGRHPFYIHLLGRKFLDAFRYGETVADAQEAFQTEAAGRLRELWASLSARDREALLEANRTPNPKSRSLRQRGLLDEGGKPFGRVLTEWLNEEVL